MIHYTANCEVVSRARVIKLAKVVFEIITKKKYNIKTRAFINLCKCITHNIFTVRSLYSMPFEC